jgi:hypothetical protein
METLTVKMWILNPDYPFKLMEDLVKGEGGDGWGYIVCDNPSKMAVDFVEHSKHCYIQSEEENYVYVGEEHEQSVWLFTSIPPDEAQTKVFDFIFEVRDV